MDRERPPRGVFNSAMCVRCLKRNATNHTGHVTAPNGRKITAGWCRFCLAWWKIGKYAGWVGHWRPEMNPRCGDVHDPGDGPTTCILDKGHKTKKHTDGGDVWSDPAQPK